MIYRILFLIKFVFIGLFIVSCSVTSTQTNTFEKVKTGMTQEQVLDAMGDANSISSIEIWKYQENDTTIDISIQNGKVINVRTVTVKSLRK